MIQNVAMIDKSNNLSLQKNKTVERVKRESHILSMTDPKYCISLFEGLSHGSDMILVTEFAAGKDLQKYRKFFKG